MRKIGIILALCCMLGLSACNTKAKEEALAQTTEVTSETAEISFTFNGYWSLQQGDEITKSKESKGQSYDFIAKHMETGTEVAIIYDDLTKTEGGTLIRMEDYVEAIRNGMMTSEDYTYQCSGIETELLLGEEYQVFLAATEEIGGVQHFYIRRIDDTMMIMVITLRGEDRLEDIISLSKKAEL